MTNCEFVSFSILKKVGVVVVESSNDNRPPTTDTNALASSTEISVDAGSKEVYEKVRRGGDWNKLIENFEFISTLEIPHFGLSMVVQDSNYKDIPKLIEIRDKYFPNGYVYFQKITKSFFLLKCKCNW